MLPIDLQALCYGCFDLCGRGKSLHEVLAFCVAEILAICHIAEADRIEPCRRVETTPANKLGICLRTGNREYVRSVHITSQLVARSFPSVFLAAEARGLAVFVVRPSSVAGGRASAAG